MGDWTRDLSVLSSTPLTNRTRIHKIFNWSLKITQNSFSHEITTPVISFHLHIIICKIKLYESWLFLSFGFIHFIIYLFLVSSIKGTNKQKITDQNNILYLMIKQKSYNLLVQLPKNDYSYDKKHEINLRYFFFRLS